MSNKEKHWEKTKGLMILTLVIWFIFGYLIFMFGSSLNEGSFLGYPLAYYMCAQGSIIAFVVLIFWFANKQEKIDEEFGFQERGEDNQCLKETLYKTYLKFTELILEDL